MTIPLDKAILAAGTAYSPRPEDPRAMWEGVVRAVLTSLSDPTPECVEAMADAVSDVRDTVHLPQPQTDGAKWICADGLRLIDRRIADYWTAKIRARASHAAFIRYVEGK